MNNEMRHYTKVIGLVGLLVLLLAPPLAHGAIATLEADFSGGGGIIVGSSTATCNAASKGGLRYNTTSNQFEYCNAAAWTPIVSVGACADTTPNAFTFTDLTAQAVSTLVTSEIVQITSIDCAVNVTVSGAGSPQYRICSNATCTPAGNVVQDWTTSTYAISSGQYLQVRQTTASTGNVVRTASISVGGGNDNWDATTVQDCSGSPTAGTVCPDGTVYAGTTTQYTGTIGGARTSNGTVKMFVTRCDSGRAWNGSACSGIRQNFTWNGGGTTWASVTPSVTSGADGQNNTGILAAYAPLGPYAAAVYCENLTENGKTDWYLPASSELASLYGIRTAIEIATAADPNYSGQALYWSSSETATSAASYGRTDYSAYQSGNLNKNNPLYVRCVRNGGNGT